MELPFRVFFLLFILIKKREREREKKNEFTLINLLSFRSCFPMESFNIIAKRSNSIKSHIILFFVGSMKLPGNHNNLAKGKKRQLQLPLAQT